MTARVKWDYAVLTFAPRNIRDIPENAAEDDETTIHVILREYGAEDWEVGEGRDGPVTFAEFNGHILDILYTFERPDEFLANNGPNDRDHGNNH